MALWSKRRTLSELGVTVREEDLPEHEVQILEFCTVEWSKMMQRKGGKR